MQAMSKVPRLNDVLADSAQLIEAVALRRDRLAFASLFEYFAPRIKTFMLRSGASETAADDLVQETMLAVWRKAELFNPDTAGSAAWIFTIARNIRIDALRREGRRLHNKATDIDIEFLLDKAPLPNSILAATQVQERVRIALSELSVEQQRVVQLSFYQERAHAEIAKALGIPLGTVKSRLRLSMVKLRSLLGDLL